MNNIYGAIGYTILTNNNKIIMIMADMHDELESCTNNISIEKWLNTKIMTGKSEVLLEEVDRTEDIELQELWSNSTHTQNLKQLFFNNIKVIKPIDIRPFMINFSWELINDEKMDENLKLTSLYDYLYYIDKFYQLKHPYLLKKNFYNKTYLEKSLVGKHFQQNKNKYILFLYKFKKLLYKSINYIVNNDKDCLEYFNELLDDIMEWYICAYIMTTKKKSIILHAGLAHTININTLLINHYTFNKTSEIGINNLNNLNYLNYKKISGCVNINNNLNNLL